MALVFIPAPSHSQVVIQMPPVAGGHSAGPDGPRVTKTAIQQGELQKGRA